MATIGSLRDKSAGRATGSSTGRRKSRARKQGGGREPEPGDYGYVPPVDPAPIGEKFEVDQIERGEGGSESISEEERQRRYREAAERKKKAQESK